LTVAITVIPPAAARWFGAYTAPHHYGPVRRAIMSLFGIAPACAAATRWYGRTMFWMMNEWRAWTLRPALILGLMALSLFGAWKLAPPLDYLPAGNRNLVFGGLLIPPGYSIDQMATIAERIEAQVRPYMLAAQDPSLVPGLAPIPRPPTFDPQTGQPVPQPPFEPVPVDNNFIGSFSGTMFTGATSQIADKVLPVGQLLTNAMGEIPDSFGGASQSSLFGRGPGGGSGNTIDLEISGPDLVRVKAAAAAIFGSLAQSPQYGYARVRPDPANFTLQQPETRVEVNDLGSELGLRTADVGVAVQALFDGAYVGDFRTLGDTIDMRMLPVGGRLDYRDLLAEVPMATPAGPVVPVSSVVRITEGLAPQEIQRIEELPSVTLRVQPPQGMPLETVMADITENHVGAAEASGLLDSTMSVRLQGTAAKLDEVKAALIGRAPAGDRAGWQTAADVVLVGFLAVAAGVALWSFVRAARRKRADFVWGGLGVLGAAVVVVGFGLLIAENPHLVFARMVWALAVTYLLMCALYESFVFPLVIMFSVPLAIVGGFAALRLVHNWTAANPMINTQNLDVLTMLGFVILIGVVVNNAILIVHQSLALMRGEADTQRGRHEALPPLSAIAEATHSRVRPIFMTATTSVLGMLPLVLFPGAGSELYRGLGAVVCGGLIVSTVFTLIIVPLTLSMVVQMMEGVNALFGRKVHIAARFELDDALAASSAEPVPVPAAGRARRPEAEPAGV
jgi:HAE1 family hydrophobic/amphiphilic exporter-1